MLRDFPPEEYRYLLLNTQAQVICESLELTKVSLRMVRVTLAKTAQKLLLAMKGEANFEKHLFDSVPAHAGQVINRDAW